MSQNRYLWGVCYPTLSEWSGHDPEELHEHLKDRFLEREQRELPNGTVMVIHPTTRTLTVEQFSAYVDRVVRWAAEQGVRIPDANEVG